MMRGSFAWYSFGELFFKKPLNKRFPFREWIIWILPGGIHLRVNDVEDLSPPGQTADIPVIDIKIGLDFATDLPLFENLFRIIFIDCIEFHAVLPAKFHGFVQLLSTSVCPEDQLMTLLLELFQRFKSKQAWLPDGGKLVFYDGTVKIDCYFH